MGIWVRLVGSRAANEPSDHEKGREIEHQLGASLSQIVSYIAVEL
jgi:hypothetical protein